MAEAVQLEIAQNAVIVTAGNDDIDIADMGGETPKAALHFMTAAITAGTARNENNLCIGAAVSGSQRWQISASDEHAQGTTDTSSNYQTDEVLALLSEGSLSIIAEADHVSFAADKETINWADAPNAAYLLNSLMFAGAGVSVAAGLLDTDATVGNVAAVSGLAFQPTQVFFATVDKTGVGGFDGGRLGFGWAVDNNSTIQQVSQAHTWRNGQVSGDPRAAVSATRCMTTIDSASIDHQYELTAFNADGFDVTTRIGTTSIELAWFAVRLANVSIWAGQIDSPTAIGDWVITAPGFKPQFVMLGLNGLASVDTVADAGNAGSCGYSMFTPARELCVAVACEDASDPTDTQSMAATTAVNMPDDDGATGFVATFSSMEANGWKLNFSAENVTTARKWIGLAVGEVSAGGIIPQVVQHRRQQGFI